MEFDEFQRKWREDEAADVRPPKKRKPHADVDAEIIVPVPVLPEAAFNLIFLYVFPGVFQISAVLRDVLVRIFLWPTARTLLPPFAPLTLPLRTQVPSGLQCR